LEKPRNSVKSAVHTMSQGEIGRLTAATPASALMTNPAEMLMTSRIAVCLSVVV
jgi:hypothetical protein